MKQTIKKFIKKSGPMYRFLRKLVYRKRLFKDLPDGITVELTSRCNSLCSYCPKSKGVGIDRKDMDFELFKKIIDEATRVINLKQVCLVGFGEPLLYPKLFEAIRYIKEKNPRIKVPITTNAILLIEENGKNIVESGVDSLTISINSFGREKYRLLNNVDFYEKVEANVRNFLTSLKSRPVDGLPRLYIQILDGVNTEEEIQGFIDYWTPLLPPNAEIQVQPFVNWAGEIENPRASASEERYPCGHLYSWIITAEGEAVACCMVLPGADKTLFLGSVKEKSLIEIYTGEKIKNLRRLNLEGKLEQVPICAKCDAWKTSVNVWFKNKYIQGIRKWI